MSAMTLAHLQREPTFLAIATDGPHANRIATQLVDMTLRCPRIFELLDRQRSRMDYLICLAHLNSPKPVMAFRANGAYSLRQQTTRAVSQCRGAKCLWYFGLDAAADAIVRDALRGVSARFWRPSLADVEAEGNA